MSEWRGSGLRRSVGQHEVDRASFETSAKSRSRGEAAQPEAAMSDIDLNAQPPPRVKSPRHGRPVRRTTAAGVCSMLHAHQPCRMPGGAHVRGCPVSVIMQ